MTAPPFKTIIAAYDASQASDRALEQAAVLCEILHARLIVVSVGRPLPVYLGADVVGAPPVFDDSGREVADEHLGHARGELEGRDLEVEFAPTVGRWSESIIELAVKRGADLIVVGSRHQGFLDRLLNGRVNDDIARRAPCDVLIVH